MIESEYREKHHQPSWYRAGLGEGFVRSQPLVVVLVLVLVRLLCRLLGILAAGLDPRLSVAGAAKVVCTNAVEACGLGRLGGA